MRRRRFITTVTLATAGIAGCTNSGSNSSDSSQDESAAETGTSGADGQQSSTDDQTDQQDVQEEYFIANEYKKSYNNSDRSSWIQLSIDAVDLPEYDASDTLEGGSSHHYREPSPDVIRVYLANNVMASFRGGQYIDKIDSLLIKYVHENDAGSRPTGCRSTSSTTNESEENDGNEEINCPLYQDATQANLEAKPIGPRSIYDEDENYQDLRYLDSRWFSVDSINGFFEEYVSGVRDVSPDFPQTLLELARQKQS